MSSGVGRVRNGTSENNAGTFTVCATSHTVDLLRRQLLRSHVGLRPEYERRNVAGV